MPSLEIVARIGAVEGLVAERKVRDDIAFDRRLKQRPLKPGWVAQVAPFDLSIPQAEPNEDVAAKSLDDGHTFTGFPNWVRLCPQRALGKPVQYLVDQ